MVTNLSRRRVAAKRLYEKLYCARGEMENRIKEPAGVVRRFPTVFFLVGLSLRRLGLEGTQMAHAQSTTIRLKLLKIGARLRITVRKVWLSFLRPIPTRATFEILANLRRYPAWAPPVSSSA